MNEPIGRCAQAGGGVVKVWLSQEEIWPALRIDTEPTIGFLVEMTDELRARVDAAEAEWCAVQNVLWDLTKGVKERRSWDDPSERNVL